MAAELSDAAAKATKLALKMGSAPADAIAVMADLGEELPFLEPVLKTIKAIREKRADAAVKRNQKELAVLEERCTYITACVVEKHRLMPTSEKDVTPLQNCVEAVEAFVELRGRNSRSGHDLNSDDKGEIAGLNARVDRLPGDLQLAGIATMEVKIAKVCIDYCSRVRFSYGRELRSHLSLRVRALPCGGGNLCSFASVLQ